MDNTLVKQGQSAGSPDYGVDAPGVIRNFILLGAAMMLVGFSLPSFWASPISAFLSQILIYWGGAWIVTSLLMLLYAKAGKFKHRDRMLRLYEWKGNEAVLDIGTGRGLLAIGAAKKLRTGNVVGIDIWNAEDLSQNNETNTLNNLRLEGVASKVELKTEDVRKMTFPDQTFDVIVSNLCVHNIYQAAEREKACREIVRVLKPGGVALISDFRHTGAYANVFRGLGLTTEKLGPFWTSTFPPLTVVRAKKNITR